MKKTLHKTKHYIELSKRIYDIHEISKAVSAYSGVAKLSVDELESHYRVSVLKAKYDGEITLKEFENYLIDSMN